MQALPELHAAFGNVAGHRRNQRGARMSQVGLTQIGRRGHDLWVRSHHGVIDQRSTGTQLLAGTVDRRLGNTQVVARMGKLFAGNSAAFGQHLAPVEVLLGLAQFSLTRLQLSLERVDIAVKTAHLPDGTCKVGLRRLQRDLTVGRVELQQDLAGMHEVAIVGADAGHRPGDQWRDFDHVAVDVGVIGALVPTPNQAVPGPGAQPTEDQQHQQANQPELALARGGGCLGRCRGV